MLRRIISTSKRERPLKTTALVRTPALAVCFVAGSSWGQSLAWKQLPGAGNDIGVGGDGSVFAVGPDGKAWSRSGKAWIARDGLAASIGVDGKGKPWATAPDKSVWQARPG